MKLKKKHKVTVDLSFDLPNEHGKISIACGVISLLLMLAAIFVSSVFSRTYPIKITNGVLEIIALYTGIVGIGMGGIGLNVRDSAKKQSKYGVVFNLLLLLCHGYIYFNAVVR